MQDQLTTCKRCGSNACYEQHIDESTTTWLCMGCGFTTSTLMTKDSPILKQAMETSPELYKTLLFEDIEKRFWLPAVITLPDQGMVYLDGTSDKNWKWAAVKSIPLSKEDKEEKINGRPKYPKGVNTKADMKNIQHFEQTDFMDALEVIGFYNLG